MGPREMNEKYILRSGRVAFRALGEETMIMSAVDSTLFTLNDVGTKIWHAADGTIPLSEIIRRHVCSEFEVSPDAAYADALAFTEDLARNGILLVSEKPFGDPPAMNS